MASPDGSLRGTAPRGNTQPAAEARRTFRREAPNSTKRLLVLAGQAPSPVEEEEPLTAKQLTHLWQLFTQGAQDAVDKRLPLHIQT